MDIQKESEEKAVALRAQVDALEVIDQASYDQITEIGNKAKKMQDDFHAFDDPVHDPIVKAWQASCTRRKKIDDACKYVIDVTGRKSGRWMKAEQDRVAEEKRAEEARLRKIEEDKALIEAQALEDAGMSEAAAERLDAPVVVPRPILASPLPLKASGTAIRETFHAEVRDLMTLVKAVAAGTAPLHYLLANESALNSEARSSKGQASIPGVVMTSDIKQGSTGR